VSILQANCPLITRADYNVRIMMLSQRDGHSEEKLSNVDLCAQSFGLTGFVPSGFQVNPLLIRPPFVIRNKNSFCNGQSCYWTTSMTQGGKNLTVKSRMRPAISICHFQVTSLFYRASLLIT
jgi:hypothetical protein